MKYVPTNIELEILDFWTKKKIYPKLKKKVAKGPKYYFLDGPPYTSGRIHVGHAWNYALKDCYRRFLRMRGINVNDRPGFDMHGLPIEVKVEKKLGLSKKDINKFGVDKFVKECKNFAIENMQPMIADFKRLGIWMDWDNPYMTIKNGYIEGAWWALKQAYEKGLLYRGKKVMTWCPRCATALAKHELEYEMISDESIFVKLKVVGRENEFLIIWTTTPWTIPFNLAVMVNPNLEYVRAKVGNEIWIVAKALVNSLLGVLGKSYEILEEFKGDKLEGLEYIHPLLDEIPSLKELKAQNKWVHRVILSEEFVDVSAGTGLVHCAPGCGPEDQQAGAKYGLPPYNEIDEHGVFPDSMGKYAGLVARKDDSKFIKELEHKNAVLRKAKVEHEYAHCWRCKTAVIFRATEQWFIAVERLKNELLEANKKIEWIPRWAGENWFTSWLENLQDWCISRQRYWGIPLPIWICDCGAIYVVGEIKELKKLAGKVPKDLHKPWIDDVKIKCECGKYAKRVPDVLDVWLDSAAATWATLPKKDWQNAIADFILEGKDQIRGWFNSLLSLSWAAREKPAYKSVYMHGMILDAYGRKMSKSLGNIIRPSEVIDNWGADTFRYYTIGGADPGLDLNYNFEDVKVKNRLLNVFWNIHVYLINYSKYLGIDLSKVKLELKDVEDKYIISKTNSIIKKLTKLFEARELASTPHLVEELFLELSRWYIKTIRDEIEPHKLKVLYECYLNVLKLAAPIIPFITEAIWQNLKAEFKLKEESVHLADWPIADESKIDLQLESDIEVVKELVSDILAARDQIKRNVRWPIKKIILVPKKEGFERICKSYFGLIKKLTNVWELEVKEEVKGIKKKVQADYNKIVAKHGDATPKIIAKIVQLSPESILEKVEKEGKYIIKADSKEFEIGLDDLIVTKILPSNLFEYEGKLYTLYIELEEDKQMLIAGYTRELIRKIQDMRKKAGLEKPDKIQLFVVAEKPKLLKIDEIKEKVGAEKIQFVSEIRGRWRSKFDIRGEKFEIGFDLI